MNNDDTERKADARRDVTQGLLLLLLGVLLLSITFHGFSQHPGRSLLGFLPIFIGFAKFTRGLERLS